MSAPDAISYEVDLTQLAPGATRAGAGFAPLHLAKVSEKDLRALLLAAEALAPQVSYPLAPELRITAPAGKFVVMLKEGHLRFVSWVAAKSAANISSVDQMLAFIRGDTVGGDADEVWSAASAGRQPLTGGKRLGLLALLVLVVVGVNYFTVSQARKPPGNFLPEFRLLDPEPADRLLARVAGNYETGSAPGDRRLQIGPKGAVTWIKFGRARSTVEIRTFTAQAAESVGAQAVLTSRQSLIKIKDSSVILFGDTYVRVLN